MGSLMTDEFSLSWKNFETNLAKYFSEMRDDSDFFDVKIACFDDKSVMKTIPAHKMVLSACSPVFKELLREISSGDSKNPLLFLRGITYQEMSAILDFMYNGEAKVQQNQLDAFLAVSEELKIRGLSTENKGYSRDSTPLRKRPSQHEERLESNGVLKSKIKKIRTFSPIGQQRQHDDTFEKKC